MTSQKLKDELLEDFDIEILAKTYIDAKNGLPISVDEKRVWFRSALDRYARAYARSVVPREDKDMPERWLSHPNDFVALAWNACREEMLKNIEK